LEKFSLVSSILQLGFLGASAFLGHQQGSIWWLIPLTIAMAIAGWLTDQYWKIRFYDIYGIGDWVKFWLETLFGLTCFMIAAFFAGHLLRHGAGLILADP
jgi:hypothetical protein